MKAIITGKKLHPMSGDHQRPYYLGRVTCPGCKHEHRLSFAGWSAIVCQGCRAELQRPARGKHA